MTADNGDSVVEIRRVQGYVVVDQEYDADGRAGRWRRMEITLPVYSGIGINTTVTMVVDFPDEGAGAGQDTWNSVVGRMGGFVGGKGDDES